MSSDEEDPVEELLAELDQLNDSDDPSVALFDKHDADPVVVKYEDELRWLSSRVVFARRTDIEEFRDTWDRHGEPRVVDLSTQSHRFEAEHFEEVTDLE